MDYCSNFRYDLKVGQVAEQALGDIFEKSKVEVKRDLKAHITGNLFIEYKSRGKVSGIEKSEADFWCFALENVFILAEKDYVLKLIEPLKNTKADVRGGDNNTSRGILLPIRQLANYTYEKNISD
nr:hypothetical protein [uncultured Mediterranean phage uvMED]